MKKQIYTCAVILALTFSACGAGNNGKPLIGGIAERATDNVSGEANDKSGDTQIASATDGMEIPAPITSQSEQILQREGYTVSYNSETKLPNWVAWHLTADRLESKASRKDKDFAEDEEVKAPRATDKDYYCSRYDRGHMCPAGDNKWSETAMTQSFLFTNICPQAPNLNRGDWNEMENQCRKWVKEGEDLYIVCGPILYKGKHKTIGRNKVIVPEAFFKVVLSLQGTPKAIGFIYKNADGNRPKGDYVNSVDEVERITGYDFFPALPDDVEKKVEAEADAAAWGI